MRTLDEVIKAVSEDLEQAAVTYPECFYDYENHKDALTYLKEFKVVTDICHKHGIASIWGQVLPEVEKTDWEKKVKFDDTVDNDPLTWSEMKQMIGKPVWLEDSNQQGEWVLLSGMEDDVLYFVYSTCNEYKIYRKEQGVLWQAYRKERS